MQLDLPWHKHKKTLLSGITHTKKDRKKKEKAMTSTPTDLNNPAHIGILPDGWGWPGIGLVWSFDYCFQVACMPPSHVQNMWPPEAPRTDSLRVGESGILWGYLAQPSCQGCRKGWSLNRHLMAFLPCYLSGKEHRICNPIPRILSIPIWQRHLI